MGRTNDKLKGLTTKQADEIGVEVDRLMGDELDYVVNMYVCKYRNAVRETLGWTKEDLEQEIRVALWKGLATFDKSRAVKVTTYLSATLHNLFANIAKTCKAAKNHGAQLSKEAFLLPSQEPSDPFDAECWSEYIRRFDLLMENLTPGEVYVMRYVLLNDTIERDIEGLSPKVKAKPSKKPKFTTIEDVAISLAIKRSVVVAIVLSIKNKMQRYLEVDGDGDGDSVDMSGEEGTVRDLSGEGRIPRDRDSGSGSQ